VEVDQDSASRTLVHLKAELAWFLGQHVDETHDKRIEDLGSRSVPIRSTRESKVPLYKLFLQHRTKPDPVFDELLAIAATVDEEILNLMTGLLRTVKEWKSQRNTSRH